MNNMLVEFFDCRIIAETYSTSFPDVYHVTWKALFSDATFVIDSESFLPLHVVSDSHALSRIIYESAAQRLASSHRSIFFFDELWKKYSSFDSYEHLKICTDKLF